MVKNIRKHAYGSKQIYPYNMAHLIMASNKCVSVFLVFLVLLVD